MLVLVIGDLHLPHRASDLPSKFRKLLVPGKIQQIICTGNVCDRETLDYLRTIAGDVHIVRGDWDDNPYFSNSLILHHPPLRIGVLHGHQIVPPGDAESQCALARSMDVDILITGHTHRFDAFERQGRFFVNPGSATGAWSSVWPIAANEEELEDEEPAAEKAIEPEAKEEGKKEVTEGKSEEKKVEETTPDDVAAKDDEAADKDTNKDTEATDDMTVTEKPSEASKAKEPIKVPEAAAEPTPSFALLDIQGPVVVTYVYQLIDGEVKVEKMEFRKKLETGAPGSPGYIPTSPASATRRPAAGARY